MVSNEYHENGGEWPIFLKNLESGGRTRLVRLTAFSQQN